VPRSQKISEELSHFAQLLERVIEQAKRRVVEEEQVPAAQKLVSIFEPHTAIIRRGKARKQTPSSGGRCGSLRWKGAS
jgi:IS5 family transposase